MAGTTYNVAAKVPDIGKIITNITPHDTPLFSMFGTGDKATQTHHQWEEDTLTGPRKNAQIEGFSYVTEKPTEPVLKENITQIFSRGYKVTDTRQAIKHYNVKDFLASKMLDAMKDLATDVERAIIQQEKKVMGNDSTAREMGGIQYFIKSNVLKNSGTARAFTYKLLNDALEDSFKLGGNPDVIVVSGRNKRILTDFLPNATQRRVETDNKKMVHTIDVFEGDFGRQRVVTDRWMPNDKAFILTSKYWKMSYLRPFKTEELPKTSDSTQKVIVGELTLEARAEKASAIIADLNGTIAS